MRFYLVKILFVTEPFEFRHLKVYGHESGLKELKRLKNWRYDQYHALITSHRAVWTEEKSNLRNIYLQFPVDPNIKIPPLNRIHHAFASHVMPYLTHKKDPFEDRGKHY